MLGDIGVGAGQEDHPVGLMGHGGPHFLTVDHPLVAIADGLRGDGRHIRTMVGLAVAEAAVELTRQEPFEYLRVVEIGSHGVDDAGHQHGDGQPVVGRSRLLEFVEQHVQLDRVAVAIAWHRTGQQSGLG